MPTVIVPDRICKKCGGNAWYFRKTYNVDTGISSCATCRRKAKDQWRINNPEKAKLSEKRWRVNNPEKVAAVARNYRKKHIEHARVLNRKWRQENPEKFRESVSKSGIRACQNLSDSYIKSVIQKAYYYEFGEKLKCADITQEAIEDHRILLQNKRIIQEFKILREMKTSEPKVSRKEHLAALRAMTPEERKKRDDEMQKVYQARHEAKKKAEKEALKLTHKSLNELATAGIGTQKVKNPKKVEAAKKMWEEKKAAVTIPNIPTLGVIESLINDLNTLTARKQEILNHLESIKQLVNQF